MEVENLKELSGAENHELLYDNLQHDLDTRICLNVDSTNPYVNNQFTKKDLAVLNESR